MIAPTRDSVIVPEDWELEITIIDSPVVLPTACDTSDGCQGSCASACVSR